MAIVSIDQMKTKCNRGHRDLIFFEDADFGTYICLSVVYEIEMTHVNCIADGDGQTHEPKYPLPWLSSAWLRETMGRESIDVRHAQFFDSFQLTSHTAWSLTWKTIGGNTIASNSQKFQNNFNFANIIEIVPMISWSETQQNVKIGPGLEN